MIKQYKIKGESYRFSEFNGGFCPYFAGVPMSGKVVSVLGLARPYVASATISVSPSMSEAENLLFSFAGTPALKLNRAKP